MVIVCHLVAASVPEKRLNLQQFIALIDDLLNKHLVRLPGAILVGEASNNTSPSYWSGPRAIVPNTPGRMLTVKSEQFPKELIQYYGNNCEAFHNELSRVPLGEKQCCVCFPTLGDELTNDGWDGVVIYALTHPFAIDFEDTTIGGTSIHQNFAHFFTLFSTVGGGGEPRVLLRKILAQYFGPGLFLEEAITA